MSYFYWIHHSTNCQALAFIVFKLRYLIINNLFITLNCTCFSFPNRTPLQSVCGIFKSWELSLSVLTRLWACGIPAMKKSNTTIKMHIWASGFLTSRPKMYLCMDNQTLRYTFHSTVDSELKHHLLVCVCVIC